MGSQLWTSSITGYRRKGTRFSELRSVLAAGVVARAIMEPLRSCAIDADALEIKQILEMRGFDRAGVKIINEGSVIGYVERNRLIRGAVKDFVQPVSTEFLVSDATPINVLLSVLGRKEYLFVLVGTEISGIITRADLNKPMVRVYLFGLISLLEMHLRFWVRLTYADESWSKLLKKERIELAYALQRQRMARNEDITLLDCLQFCDTRDLFTSNADVMQKLGLETKKQAQRFLRRAEELRNRLAHSQEDLVQGSSWPEVIILVEWMEALVHRSDEAVEFESKSAKTILDNLWSTSYD